MAKFIKKFLNYRELFYIFIWKDLTVKYKQAALGIAWALIQPLSYMLLFTFIFTYAMPIRVSTYPTPLFFYTGILHWMFVSYAITHSIQILVFNCPLLRKIYFPPALLPLSSIVTAFIDFLISFGLFLLLIAFYRAPISLTALWYFPLLLLLLMFVTSMCLVLSVLNVYYRDVGLVSGFLMQVLFFSTPILYSIDKMSSRFKPVLFLNPLTFIIENMRRCLFEHRPVLVWQYAIMFCGLLCFFILSYNFFKTTERKLVDVL